MCVCVCLLLVRYNDVAGVWRSNLLVSQMDLTLATKTERDSDSESGRERRGEEKRRREREADSKLGHCWNWPGTAAKLH